MALILNIETATENCSVALAKDGKLLYCVESTETKIHASHLTVFIEEVIKSAGINYHDLDAIAVSKGPGSYTGLRIGVATAKGLCFALNKPLLSVSTLLSFATHLKSHYLNIPINDGSAETLLCPMIDARRMEVYTALFDMHFNMVQPTAALILDQYSYSELLQTNKMVFFGSGATKWQQFALTHVNAIFVKDFETSAKGMIKWSEALYKSGSMEDLAYFEPDYLKDFISGQLKKKI